MTQVITMPAPVQQGTCTTSDGVAIAFTRRAAPSTGAPRIVLIHSLALDRSIWDAVADALQNHAEVLTYDCRGHGRSERRAGQFTAELFARDLLELLDHVGWQQATIAGCSMGGCVALAFAGRVPGRVNRLGLIDTTAWYGPAAGASFRARAAAAREAGMAGLVDFQVTRWFSDGFRVNRPDLVERATEVFLDNDFDCYAASCALLGDADLRPHLASLAMPVVIVVGEDDAATPVAMAHQLHAAIPQSTLHVVAGARHLTPIECPGAITQVLHDLLRGAT
jgi:3-oxoadipate enol-lactonase